MTYSNKKECQNCKYFIEREYPLGICNHPNNQVVTGIRQSCNWFVLDTMNGKNERLELPGKYLIALDEAEKDVL